MREAPSYTLAPLMGGQYRGGHLKLLLSVAPPHVPSHLQASPELLSPRSLSSLPAVPEPVEGKTAEGELLKDRHIFLQQPPHNSHVDHKHQNEPHTRKF